MAAPSRMLCSTNRMSGAVAARLWSFLTCNVRMALPHMLPTTSRCSQPVTQLACCAHAQQARSSLTAQQQRSTRALHPCGCQHATTRRRATAGVAMHQPLLHAHAQAHTRQLAHGYTSWAHGHAFRKLPCEEAGPSGMPRASQGLEVLLWALVIHVMRCVMRCAWHEEQRVQSYAPSDRCQV